MKTKLQVINKGYRETELGELPNDWEVVKLKEVCEKMKAGGTPLRSKKEYYGGNIPFVLIEDMTASDLYLTKTKECITEKGLENSNTWIVPTNSILLSMYATIGATAINKIPVATNQAILAIIPKKGLDSVFAAYNLRYHAERLKSHNIATTQKNVNKGIVENFLIPLPPLPEQQKIAFVLSTVQDAQEKTERVINSLKELKKSMMKHLFTYGAVSFEDVDKVRLKETEIGKVPEGWEVKKLGDIVDTYSGGTPNRGKKSYWENGTIPWAKSGELGDKRIDKVEENITKDGLENSSTKYVGIGDLLVAMYGATAGKVGLARFKFTINQAICGIKPNEKFDSEFYFYYLILIRDKLLSQRFGGAQPNINQQIIKSLKIPIPSIQEQQQIANILFTIDEKIEAEEQRKKALDEMFKSLLKNLMTARLRVNDLVM
jgi:type I restriction enzyme S subunit